MKNLPWSEKRGRPDIVHFSLLEALGSPLNKEGLLQVYVHTISNCIISINPETRLPRNYDRFVGLLEQLFKLGQIPSNGPALLTLVENTTLPKLVKRIKPDYTVAFSRAGIFKTLQECVSAFIDKKNPLVIVGGFPHGTLSTDSRRLADEVVAIDREMLETWTLTARIVYEYEKLLNLPGKRLITK
jgi:rRNA small subunit pseudouridine methyltransferase Nep1